MTTPVAAAQTPTADPKPPKAEKVKTEIVTTVHRIKRREGDVRQDIPGGTVIELPVGAEFDSYIALEAIREPTEAELAVYENRKGKKSTSADLLG